MKYTTDEAGNTTNTISPHIHQITQENPPEFKESIISINHTRSDDGDGINDSVLNHDKGAKSSILSMQKPTPKPLGPSATKKPKVQQMAICQGSCSCDVCKGTSNNLTRLGIPEVIRPFQEEANFRKFASTTKTLDNYIDMHNLDEKTREIIRYYQKLNGAEEGEEEQSKNPMAYARLIADLHRKKTLGIRKES